MPDSSYKDLLLDGFVARLASSFGRSQHLYAQFTMLYPYISVQQRFLHFAGQHGAKLSLSQNFRGINKGTSTRTWLIRSVSPFLLYTAEVHLKSFEQIVAGGMFETQQWRTSFMARLEDEWGRCIICVRSR